MLSKLVLKKAYISTSHAKKKKEKRKAYISTSHAKLWIIMHDEPSKNTQGQVIGTSIYLSVQ